MRKPNFSLRIGMAAPVLLSALAGCAGAPRPAPVAIAPSSAPAPAATQPPTAQTATERAAPKPGGGYYKDDGPGDNPPPNLDAIPDATPRLEPLHRFANRPYIVLGQAYTPDTELHPYRETGAASWYGRRYHGSRTSSGEPYDMYAMTAAHRTLPIPSYARVTNAANSKSVVVRINDRGPFHEERLIDVSYTAAHKLGILQNGSLQVQVEALDPRNPVVAPPPANPKPEAALAAAPQPANAAQAFTTAPENGGVYVQLGAFSVQENAEQFRSKLGMDMAQFADKLQVMPQGGLFKVRAGPYPNIAGADQAAAEIRKALNVNAVVISR
ncbi:MAG: septal ring lytic transglycosylase RlpA family protein [Sulfuricellaceae bacterium]